MKNNKTKQTNKNSNLQETGAEPCKECYSHVPFDLLSLPSCTFQVFLSRDGNIHSGLGTHTSVCNQENSPQVCVQVIKIFFAHKIYPSHSFCSLTSPSSCPHFLSPSDHFLLHFPSTMNSPPKDIKKTWYIKAG